MPLSGSVLGDAIAAAVSPLKTAVDPFTQISAGEIDAIETARSTAVVDHITGNAVVNTNVTVAGGSSSGSHPGVGTVS